MTSVGWLTRWLADVPPDDGWLSPGEREVLAGLRVEKRRSDWRLGRFTAKTAVARWLGVPISHVEIVAAADGAPEARLDGGAAPVSPSLSHHAERALVVVGDAATSLGCDLELIEPRSRAFVSDWSLRQSARWSTVPVRAATWWPTSHGPPSRPLPRCAGRACASTCDTPWRSPTASTRGARAGSRSPSPGVMMAGARRAGGGRRRDG
jgi:hypothetical protein